MIIVEKEMTRFLRMKFNRKCIKIEKLSQYYLPLTSTDSTAVRLADLYLVASTNPTVEGADFQVSPENIVLSRYNADGACGLAMNRGGIVFTHNTSSTPFSVNLKTDIYDPLITVISTADSKQPKITATGTTNLLSAPSTVGGQPGAVNPNTLNVNSAATFTTARTLNGVSFNGSANIQIPSNYYRNGTLPSVTANMSIDVSTGELFTFTANLAALAITLTGTTTVNMGLKTFYIKSGAIVPTGWSIGNIRVPGVSAKGRWTFPDLAANTGVLIQLFQVGNDEFILTNYITGYGIA
jgi:hypothetical protein